MPVLPWQRAGPPHTRITGTEDSPSPEREPRESAEAADPRRPRRRAVAAAAAVALLVTSSAAAVRRAGPTRPSGVPGAGVTQLSEDGSAAGSSSEAAPAVRPGKGDSLHRALQNGSSVPRQSEDLDTAVQRKKQKQISEDVPVGQPQRSPEAELVDEPGPANSSRDQPFGFGQPQSSPKAGSKAGVGDSMVMAQTGCTNWESSSIKTTSTDGADMCVHQCRMTEGCVAVSYQVEGCSGDGEAVHGTEGLCVLLGEECVTGPNPCWKLYTLPYPVQESEPADTVGGARAGTGRKGSFLVLGDWGWDEGTHGNLDSSSCQRDIAAAMLNKMQELGDVKFVINVGDSFYPSGVGSRSDPKWDSHWRERYPPELRSVPWYSTYGNHDYHVDPCACSDSAEDCAQFNNNASDTNWFFFPNFSWYKEHPELGLEVVSLDLNHYMDAWKGREADLLATDCMYSPCVESCIGNLRNRADEAIELFKSRSQASAAKNMLVFSHYPTDYLWPSEDLMNGLRSSESANGAPRHIEYFGGHRHNVDQDSCTSIAPNSHWLVGGGGGWGTEGGPQGFVVGEIGGDFAIVTYPVLVDLPCGGEGNIQFK